MAGAVLILLVACLVASARAQPAASAPSADELVAEGQKLARDGRIADSLPLFRDAARLEPSGERECLVALTYFRLKRHPEAWLHLERAKKLGARPQWCGDKVLMRDVERALADGGFAPVEITAEPAGARLTVSSLAPDEKLVAPVRVWLPWGTQRVRAEQEGFEGREVDVVVRGKELVPVHVALDRAGIDDTLGQEGDALATKKDSPPPRARSRWPWGFVAVGVSALAGGVGFHVAAASSRDAAAALYEGPAYDAEIDRFGFRRNAAIGLYVAGAALTAVGVGLLMRSGGEQEPAAVSLLPVPGGVALWVRIDR